MNPLLFTDPAFLFCFAPIVLTLYYVIPPTWRNPYLLACSLILYVWGESKNSGTLLLSIAMNYACGLRIKPGQRLPLILGVSANLILLAVFKYPAFIVTNINVIVPHPLPVPKIALPVGLSFFTFMAISYLVDIFRQQTGPERNPITFGTYLAMFPHLIAGPIVRFQDLAAQLHNRTVTAVDITQGIRLFVIGLGKKVLIGNTVAVPADAIFALPTDQLSTPIAWIGAICYTVQIYFDFSGYSDMAIGLARMLGFHFLENFRHPYISQSITEFWRRWHISLSSWLRDYLYLPLQSRSPGLRSRNTLIVFLLCGLWHGSAWHFVFWGLYHGLFRILERTHFRGHLEAAPAAFRHAYTLLVVIGGWVLFRAGTLPAAGSYLLAMAGLGHAPLADPQPQRYLTLDVVIALLFGVAASAPSSTSLRSLHPAVQFAALAAMFVTALALTSAQTYNPFIYFRF